jgi:hypothetical protein
VKESNIPVIIGTGQLVDREADIDQHIEPLDMLARVAHGARKDAELTEQDLQKLDTIALVGILGWHPDNAPNLVAEKIGAHPKHEYVSGTGGQVGVTLLNSMASEIVRGESCCGQSLQKNAWPGPGVALVHRFWWVGMSLEVVSWKDGTDWNNPRIYTRCLKIQCVQSWG